MRIQRRFFGLALVVLAAGMAAGSVQAADNKDAKDENKANQSGKTKCELDFSLAGWSAFYKTAKGEGTIKCDNGQSAPVKISVKGGGLTFGKSKIEDGHGTFTEVSSIDELFGAYAHAEAHAGASKSASATALTKGEVSLAITGKGTGFDLGVDFGKFTIKRS